ncbi:hypothetical protein [Streptomyces hebeiensis]
MVTARRLALATVPVAERGFVSGLGRGGCAGLFGGGGVFGG